MNDERGSILPLALGYAVLAIAVILLCANAIDLFLAQKRLDGLADAAALAASDGFDIVSGDEGVRIELDPVKATGQAAEVVAVSPVDARLVGVDTTDGSTARATVAGTWTPFLVGALVPAGVALDATATSRVALAG